MTSGTIVITGAVSPCVFAKSSKADLQNRGVGLGIVNLISKNPSAYTVYMTSRSGNDLPNVPSSSSSTYLHRKLDISDLSSVKSLAEEIKKAHPDGIDAIINNAGVNLNPEGYSEGTIKNTMKTNFYGTQAVSHIS